MTYLDALPALLAEVAARNDVALDRVAGMMDRSIANGGVVHVFGSGHSSLLAQELFFRAGGLAPINALLDVDLTIFGEGSATAREREEGYAETVLSRYDVRPGEVLMVISTSGINAVPIEVATLARQRSLVVIGVGSAAAYGDAESRHSSGWRLWDVVDVVLDTCVPYGDAIMPVRDTACGAVSTVLGAALLNELAVRTSMLLAAREEPLPVFRSQNTPDGDAANAELIARYAPRMPLMKP